MYKNFVDYQTQYFENLFETTVVDFGYLTHSPDLEYINGNSIIVNSEAEDVLSSVCELLASGIHTTKIQFPRNLVDFGDEDDCLYLIKYTHQSKCNNNVSIELVNSSNYQQYIKLSNKLQVQEYDELYKQYENEQYLTQNNYQMYMIKVQNKPVGEFCYIPKMCAVESLIIDDQYKRQGLGSAALELISIENDVYLSADSSSIAFYHKINSEVLDSYEVKNLYGSSYGLLMYINYVADY